MGLLLVRFLTTCLNVLRGMQTNKQKHPSQQAKGLIFYWKMKQSKAHKSSKDNFDVMLVNYSIQASKTFDFFSWKLKQSKAHKLAYVNRWQWPWTSSDSVAQLRPRRIEEEEEANY